MKFPTSHLIAFLIFAASATHAAEDSNKPALKIPAPADRPIHDQAAPSIKTTPPPAHEEKKAAATAPTATPESDGIVPAPFPISRYAPLWENSPFQNESIAPPEQSEGLAQRFVLGGILRENGEPVIWIRERATQESFKVGRNASNKLGLSLVEVHEDKQKQNEATATVRLGNEQGVIKFDIAAAPGMGLAPQPAMRPGIPYPTRATQAGAHGAPPQIPMPGHPPGTPQIPGQPGGMPQATGAAITAGIPQPGVVPPTPNPGIPQPGQPQAQPGQPQQIPSPRIIRRRAIVPAAPTMP